MVAELRRLVADRERCDELVSAGDELARGSDCRVLPNVWLGSSVESQRWVRIRIPRLIEAPAMIRFLSCEPLLEPVDLKHWLLVAGQSSPIRRASAPVPGQWISCGRASPSACRRHLSGRDRPPRAAASPSVLRAGLLPAVWSGRLPGEGG